MADSLFKKIIDGEIPCHKIYEDDLVLAFLDIFPLTPGHTLVIPKEEARTLDELSAESASALGKVLPQLCRAVMTATGAADYNVLQNNGASAHQAVFHVHFHIIPKLRDGEGLGITWNSRPIDPAGAEDLSSKIRAALA